MAAVFNKRDLSEIDFSDIDELLSQLTPEETEKLSDELCHDPDDSQIPASMRCRDQTKKTPTGNKFIINVKIKPTTCSIYNYNNSNYN